LLAYVMSKVLQHTGIRDMHKILVVDDDAINRMILVNMLKIDGFDVVEASNGEEAIQQYQDEKPDVILMDIMMPVMNGYIATEKIKDIAGNDIIPVIFITAVTNEEALAKCVSSGGDDFITKPFSKTILMARIAAQIRMREMYNTIQDHQNMLEGEHVAAERIFSKLLGTGELDNSNIKYIMSSLSVFSGDVIAAKSDSDGVMNILLADAAGHGLPAAIGTVPVVDMFYTMASKGVAISDMAYSINQKLHNILPAENFVCLSLMRIISDECALEIVNCGLPDVLVYSSTNESVIRSVNSRSVPLGVLSNEQFTVEPVKIDLQEGDKVIAYSDGITEAMNSEGEMFGGERLSAIIKNNQDHDNMFEEIVDAVKTFAGGELNGDDVTLLEYTCKLN